MSKVIVVTSGKGGVGKTTSTASIGAALAQTGQRVCVVDFDVGLRNLDLVLGAERRVVYDLINVAQGDAKLKQALIRDKRIDTLHLLAASQTRDKDALTDEGVERVMTELRAGFDWVLCDSPAGIERGALLAMRFADKAVVVTNPEVSSVRDSDRIIGLLDSKTRCAERGERMDKQLLLTRYDQGRCSRGEMLSVADVLDILAIPLLGIIPESTDILRASNLGAPVTINSTASVAGRAYRDAARRLAGESVPIAMPDAKKTLLTRVFGRRRRHEPVWISKVARHGAGGARASPDPARARALLDRLERSARDPARRVARHHRAPYRIRSGKAVGEAGARRLGLDAGDRRGGPERQDRLGGSPPRPGPDVGCLRGEGPLQATTLAGLIFKAKYAAAHFPGDPDSYVAESILDDLIALGDEEVAWRAARRMTAIELQGWGVRSTWERYANSVAA